MLHKAQKDFGKENEVILRTSVLHAWLNAGDPWVTAWHRTHDDWKDWALKCSICGTCILQLPQYLSEKDKELYIMVMIMTAISLFSIDIGIAINLINMLLYIYIIYHTLHSSHFSSTKYRMQFTIRLWDQHCWITLWSGHDLCWSSPSSPSPDPYETIEDRAAAFGSA